MRFSKTYFLAPWILAFWETLLQQYLPFTVLKHKCRNLETILLDSCNSTYRLRYWNFAVFCPFRLITHKGCNSTYRLRYWNSHEISPYHRYSYLSCNSTYRLRYWNIKFAVSPFFDISKLQQYLPFTVLKLPLVSVNTIFWYCCNSTYRLRYWNSTKPALCSALL